MTRYRIVLERPDGVRSPFAEVDADGIADATLRLFVQAARSGGVSIPPERHDPGKRYALEDHRFVLEAWDHDNDWWDHVAEGTFGTTGRFFT